MRFHGLALFIIWRFGDVSNVLYKFVLGRYLPPSDFGAVDPIYAAITILAIPVTVMYQLGAKSISRLLATQREAACRALVRDLTLIALVGSIISVGLVVVAAGPILERLHLDGRVYVAILAAMAVLAWWSPLVRGLIQGSGRFWITAIPSVGTPVFMLMLTLIFFIALGWGLPGALSVRVGSGVLTTVLVLVVMRKMYAGKTAPYPDERGVIVRALIPMIAYVGSMTLLMHFDTLLVRNFMYSDSGGYGAVMTMGRIPVWLVSPIVFVVFPLAAAEHAGGGDLRRFRREAVIIGGAVTALCVVAFSLSSEWLMGLWNADFEPYAGYVPTYALVMGVDAVIQVLASVEIARHRYRFLWILAPLSILSCGVLYLARDYLLLHSLIAIMAASRVIILGLMVSTTGADSPIAKTS